MSEARKPSRNFVLFLLAAIYAVSFIDRQITAILAAPIRAEFHLTDTQLGWLGGPAFAILYAVFGIPAAWLADRFSRTWIITIALALWSGFTAMSGMAVTSAQLFAARVGVGIGEAGGTAPSYSLIADYFPERERARAMAVFALGVPVGGSLGVLLGGVIGHAMGWRFAFLAVGLIGALIAPLFRLLVREPVRTRAEEAKPSIGQTAAVIAGVASFWGLALAAAVASIAGYGAVFWLPSLLQRSHHLRVDQAGYVMTVVLLVGGLIGLPLSGWLSDRLGTKNRAAYALTPAAFFLLAIPLYAVAITTPSLPLAIVLFTLAQAAGLAWLGPLPAAVQQLVPPRLRTTASAVFLFVVAIVGQCVGPPILGAISDHLHTRLGEGSLRWAMLALPGIYLVAAAILALTAGRLVRDWRQTPNG